MKWLTNIWKTFKISLTLFVLAVNIGFANSRRDLRFINDVSVAIDNSYEKYFINQEDVIELINDADKDDLLNSDFGHLNLKELEIRIESHQFVNDAQAYIDLEGNLSIDVIQNRPIARVINRDGTDFYIGVEGDILPESSHYTARVLLMQIADDHWIDGENILNSDQGKEIFELLQFIDNDEFWSAQIAGIRVNGNQEVVLEPQITKQEVPLWQTG